jgi:hypothetical protein
MSGLLDYDRPLWVGAQMQVHYLINGLDAIGQLLPFAVAAESSGERPLTRRPAPRDPTTPPGTQPAYLSRTTYSHRRMAGLIPSA